MSEANNSLSGSVGEGAEDLSRRDHDDPRRGEAQPEIPTRLNLLLVLLFFVGGVCLYVALPLLLHLSGWFALFVVPVVITSNTLWSLIHEGIHGSLHPNRGVNDLMARSLSILFGAPFEALRIGHLQHHRRNGTVFDRPEIFDPALDTKQRYAARYYFQLLIGLYISELASLVFVLLPQKVGQWALLRFAPGEDDEAVSYRGYVMQRLYVRDALRRARFDALCSLLLFSLSFYLYGEHWLILLMSFVVRGLLVSFLDNSYHYAGELGNIYAAYNAAAPRWWMTLLLHFNLHAVHHRHPGISWIHLPTMFAEENDQYAESHWKLALQQLKGPISARD